MSEPRVRPSSFYLQIDTPIKLDLFVALVTKIREVMTNAYGWTDEEVVVRTHTSEKTIVVFCRVDHE